MIQNFDLKGTEMKTRYHVTGESCATLKGLALGLNLAPTRFRAIDK